MQFDFGEVISFNKKDVLINTHKKARYVDEAIHLLGPASNNYYHWTFDLLSKMAYVNLFPALKNAPLLIDRTVQRHKTYVELLNMVDIYHHPVIWVDEAEKINVKKLHYFSMVTFSNAYRKSFQDKDYSYMSCYVKPKAIIDLYRNAVLDIDTHNDSNKRKKLFIVRDVDKFKRLENEEEAAGLFGESGYELVNPGELTIKEQAKLFYDAEIIVGDEGAALVNAMYGSSKTTIVCIMPEYWNNCQFTTIAFMAGCKSLGLDAIEVDVKQRLHRIDLDYCKRFIESLSSDEA